MAEMAYYAYVSYRIIHIYLNLGASYKILYCILLSYQARK
mgnify:FL=1